MVVDAGDGPRVKTGMAVQLDLSPVVQREQYGVLLGQVASVGSFAAMQAEVLSIFGEAQGRDLLQTGRFLVRVSLLRDPVTPTGFAWSSSAGPAQPINSGVSVSNGAIVIDSRRPICRVLPVQWLCG
jgi:HlyD family secretion protein